MPPLPKPKFNYDYDVAAQIDALRHYRDTEPGRAIPPKATDRILLATWNVANLGVQERTDKDYQLLGEIMSWFDIIAVEEVNDNLIGLRSICSHMPATYRVLVSDASGNNERLAFLYDTTKATLLEKVGEIAYSPTGARNVKLPGITQQFNGFDRNPYFAAFEAGTFKFLLAAVHLFYGSESSIDKNRRSLETYAVARWADLRRKSQYAYTRNIVPLGDFNLPKTQPGDQIFDALTKRGLMLPGHTSQIGSSIASDNHYDQIAFFPGDTEDHFTGNTGVFDYDGIIFHTLYQANQKDFLIYCRYHISDHRPMWIEFKTGP
ncbi:MAG TPA: endonuclease/exonuclease/phosphatase family protein [Chloroflexia bacterium]|jgi:endonuclease/exonuclease/phosphatase family metal-dependent hydrolase